MELAVVNVRHGGRPLSDVLEYLESLRDDSPSLHSALDLYAKVFTIQSRYRDQFVPRLPADISDVVVGLPTSSAVPGLETSPVGDALEEIRTAVAESAPERREELDTAAAALYCQDDYALLRPKAAAPDNWPARTLLQLALTPFYEKFSSAIVPAIRELNWRRAHCPVCGEEPAMVGYEAGSGQRMLQCSLCRTLWVRGRVTCAFCDNQDPDNLGYVKADGDNAHRVEICDACGRYIKAVDERALGKDAILHAEELVMASLDCEARARGYQCYGHSDKEDIGQWQ